MTFLNPGVFFVLYFSILKTRQLLRKKGVMFLFEKVSALENDVVY